MKKDLQKILDEINSKGKSPILDNIIKRELELASKKPYEIMSRMPYSGIYDKTDFDVLPNYYRPHRTIFASLKTLDELLEQDIQREKDGFPRRIKIGRLIKPSKNNQKQVVVIPTTTEPKFYHDDSITDEQETGGSGEGNEGDIIGEQPAQPQQGDGSGQGAGQGEETEHDIVQEAFDLGKILTEKFHLPNLKPKGKKPSFTKYIYDLTDRNRGFGQILEKKETLKRIIRTNALLGRINPEDIDTTQLLISPDDKVYRILSKEKDFETQAVVFFIRDYSGSMQGNPTQVVTSQHLLIYSWLMYQYQNNVVSRFIVHDTSAKEVPDFYIYYQSQVAGGTKVSPAFELVNQIVEKEKLSVENNIYVFYGTDGDDWDEDGKELTNAIRKMITYSNRIGITVARNAWGANSMTIVEKNLNDSGLLKEKPDLIKMDVMQADNAPESRIIEGIRILVS